MKNTKLLHALLTLFLLIGFTSVHTYSQGVTIGSNNPPDSSAALDIQDTTGGFLLPRLTTTQRNAIVNPAIGLQIYNTTTNCIQVYMPQSGWRDFICDCPNPPSSAFTFSDTAYLNQNVIFSATTPGMAYSWTFQSGTPSTSSQQTDTVTWSSTGTYTISLTVTNNNGCYTTTTDSIYIDSCPPPVSITFTNCGATGRYGPTQAQANATYGNGVVTVNNGIQEWVVPITGSYHIEVKGASPPPQTYTSPYNYFGRGAIIQGTVTLTSGTKLQILVGQQPTQSEFNGGAGGTFVAAGNTYQNATPIMVAGGGGSYRCGFSWPNYQSIIDASTTTSGKTTYVSGGTNGSGGSCSGSGGGSGAGFLGNGSGSGTDAQSFVNGGVGGVYNSPGGPQEGGFGGGGQGGWGGSGGGGGYSGGACGNNNPFPPAGGGGSFILSSATNVATSDGQYNNSNTFNGNPIQNLNAWNTGSGKVTITLICP